MRVLTGPVSTTFCREMKENKKQKSLASFIAGFIGERIAEEEAGLIALARRACHGKRRTIIRCRAQIERDGLHHVVTLVTSQGKLFARVWISRNDQTVQNVEQDPENTD